MSTATQEMYYKTLNGQHVNSLINWKVDQVTTDPTTAAEEGELKHHTGDSRLRFNTGGGTVETVAWLSDLTSLWENRGPYNNTSALPTAADATVRPNADIEPYDTFLVSGGDSNYAGIQGEDDLTTGDILVFLGGATPDPTDASQWVGIRKSSTPAVDIEVFTGDVPADTATVFSSTTITDVRNVSVRDNANVDITSDLVVSYTGADVTLQSSVALTGLTIVAQG